MRGHTSKHQKAIENYRFAGIFNTKLISFLIHVRLSLSLKKSKNRHEESFISVISYTFFLKTEDTLKMEVRIKHQTRLHEPITIKINDEFY
jgi:hypothetical protein